MPVDVGGHLNIGMTHPILHVLQAKAFIDKQARTAVTKLVQTDMGQTVQLQQVRKLSGDIVRP